MAQVNFPEVEFRWLGINLSAETSASVSNDVDLRSFPGLGGDNVTGLGGGPGNSVGSVRAKSAISDLARTPWASKSGGGGLLRFVLFFCGELPSMDLFVDTEYLRLSRTNVES